MKKGNHWFWFVVLMTAMTASLTKAAHHEAGQHVDHTDVVKQWMTAVNTSQAATIAAVEKYMADDGILYRRRYVGFGFTWDPRNDAGMVVGTVTSGSPVEGILQSGDMFVSVRGVAAIEENYGKLDFRGKPGEVVDAVILRDGKEQKISVARGVVAAQLTKAETIEWLRSGNPDTWAPDEWKMHEMVSSGHVVYAWTQSWNTDDSNGLPFNIHTVTRFQFNDEGQVIAVANLSEDRFQLEQTGWTVSR